MPWVIGIARNKLRMSFRRGSVEVRARRALGFEALALEDHDLEAIEAIAYSAGGPAGQLFAQLPEEERRAVRARVIDERPYGEIAAELGCSEMVVRKRVSRGLARLRERIGGPVSGFQTDYLDGVEAQLRALTERGAHRSWRSRLHAALSVRDDRSGSRPGLGVLALAGPVLAAVVIAAIVLSTLHVVGGQPSGRSQPARQAAGSQRRVPAGNPRVDRRAAGRAAGARGGVAATALTARSDAGSGAERRRPASSPSRSPRSANSVGGCSAARHARARPAPRSFTPSTVGGPSSGCRRLAAPRSTSFASPTRSTASPTVRSCG